MRARWMRILLAGVFVSSLLACSREFVEPPEPGAVIGHLRPGSGAESLLSGRVRLLECGLSAVVDPDSGYFHIPAVPSGDYTLRIDAKVSAGAVTQDCALQPAELALVRGPAVFDAGEILLSRAGAVRGQVNLPAGTSPLHTVVYLVGGDRIAHAGDTGAFLLEGLPAGSWRIGASRPGFMLDEPVEVEVPAGGEATVDLSLRAVSIEATAEVQGTVVLGNPGPAAGVLAAMREVFSSIAYLSDTDEEGRFVFSPEAMPATGLPPGLYEMRASHAGYRSVALPLIELRAGQSVALPALVLPPDEGGVAHPWDGEATGRVDDDGDGVPNAEDNCPFVPNPAQEDFDSNGVGDLCEGLTDADADGWPDVLDNCPEAFNPAQADWNEDGIGDACQDWDEDGVLDQDDLCPDWPNPEQGDLDGDGIGDACDPDIDGDGVENGQDNCPRVFNPDQGNVDGDPLGDLCDDDADGDGILNVPSLADGEDNCPLMADPFNSEALCNWDLLYAAQDEESGDIDLVHLKMGKTGAVKRRVTNLPGESWAPSLSSGYIYFHHRGREPDSRYRLYRLSVDALVNPGAGIEPEPWDIGGGDMMRPVVCQQMMFFEEYLPQERKVVVSMADVNAWPPSAEPNRIRVEETVNGGDAITNPPRAYNVREPACAINQMFGNVELAVAADFVQGELGWDFAWTVYILQGIQDDGRPDSFYLLGSDMSCAKRRPTLYENSQSPLWAFDCGAGSGTSLIDGNGYEYFVNGATNRNARYLKTADGLNLMVFQSDLAGNDDIYLARIEFSAYFPQVMSLIQLTDGPGWEGTPVWLPDLP